MKLAKHQWLTLDSLADGSEPIEQVYLDLAEDRTLDPVDLLRDLLSLYHLGIVIVYQKPLTVFGQDFPDHIIEPSVPLDIVGDQQKAFQRFCEIRTYLGSYDGAWIPYLHNGLVCFIHDIQEIVRVRSGITRSETDNPQCVVRAAGTVQFRPSCRVLKRAKGCGNTRANLELVVKQGLTLVPPSHRRVFVQSRVFVPTGD